MAAADTSAAVEPAAAQLPPPADDAAAATAPAPAPAASTAAHTQQQQPQQAANGSGKPFDPMEALKLGSMRLASIIRNNKQPGQLQQDQQAGGEGAVVARIRATAAGLGAKAKQHGSRFVEASISTAATTAEGIKRLALGEPLQALCRSECAAHPVPQLVLAACTALVAGGGTTTERLFRHNPPPELVDRLAAAAGSLSLLPPSASPHAIAALLKRFLLGLPEPLLTYRLLPQFVAAGDNPPSVQALLPQLPAANAVTLRLLMQVCSLVAAEAAVNEMDALALAEVLVPCMAFKPPAKAPQGPAGAPGPLQGLQGLAKALTLNKGAGAAAAAGGASGRGEAAAAVAGDEQQEQQQQQPQHSEEANRVVPLDEAELEALVTVVEFMISNFATVFASSSIFSSSSNGNTTGA